MTPNSENAIHLLICHSFKVHTRYQSFLFRQQLEQGRTKVRIFGGAITNGSWKYWGGQGHRCIEFPKNWGGRGPPGPPGPPASYGPEPCLENSPQAWPFCLSREPKMFNFNDAGSKIIFQYISTWRAVLTISFLVRLWCAAKRVFKKVYGRQRSQTCSFWGTCC